MQRRRCCLTGDTGRVHSRHRWARLLQREPHRWLQPIDDSGKKWLVKNVRVDRLHGGSEPGLSGEAEGRRRQRVQERARARHLGARSTIATTRIVHPPPKITC